MSLLLFPKLERIQSIIIQDKAEFCFLQPENIQQFRAKQMERKSRRQTNIPRSPLDSHAYCMIVPKRK